MHSKSDSFSVYRITLTIFFFFWWGDSFNQDGHKVDAIFNLHIKVFNTFRTSEIELDDKANRPNTIDLFYKYVDLTTVAVAYNFKTTIS